MERIYNVDWIKDSIVGNLERNFGCTLDEATEEQIYQAVALTVRDQIMDKFVESRICAMRKRAAASTTCRWSSSWAAPCTTTS